MSGPSTSKSSKEIYRDDELEEMLEAVARLQLGNKTAADGFQSALEGLIKRESRLQGDAKRVEEDAKRVEEEFKRVEEEFKRVEAEKSSLGLDIEDYETDRGILFEKIREATGLKKLNIKRTWFPKKFEVYKRGPTVDPVSQFMPTPAKKAPHGFHSKPAIASSSPNSPVSSLLSGLAKKELIQISPPKSSQLKDEKKEKKQCLGDSKK